MVEVATRHIQPPVSVEVQEVDLDGKRLVVATIPPSPSGPHMAKGVFYQRRGEVVQPMTPDTLAAWAFRRNAPKPAEQPKMPPSGQDDAIKYLAEQGARLNQSLDDERERAEAFRQKAERSSRLVAKLPELVIRGVIGYIMTKLLGG